MQAFASETSTLASPLLEEEQEISQSGKDASFVGGGGGGPAQQGIFRCCSAAAADAHSRPGVSGGEYTCRWQTETGAIMITPLPGAWPTKPGSATLPFFGVEPVILDDKAQVVSGPGEGILAFRASWPSMFRDLHGDHQRFEDTYFGPFKVRVRTRRQRGSRFRRL
jgi:hypothetical protein